MATLRKVGFLEGISLLILVGAAMPLKYLADEPMAVKIVGWIHGLLFMLYCVVLWQIARRRQWSYRKVAGSVLAALVPLGTFVADRYWKEEQREEAHEVDSGPSDVQTG